MTTARPSPLVSGPYATYDSQNGELQSLTNRFVGGARVHTVEFRTEKSKIMTNVTIDISVDITMNG